MRCGVILFIYDRPQCTERVLESLKNNSIEELYVFQDGIGEETDKDRWEKNAELIEKIDWCKVYFEKSRHKAESLDVQIIYGINKVFEQKEEIIIVEDDCIISNDCIKFMKKCFEIYRHNEKIIDVGAYLEPIKIPENYSSSVIAAGIPSGQVWGTWKNRWEKFQKDYAVIKSIGISMKNYKLFDSCGYPVKKILTDYWMLGTWDLWWSIYVLVREGISIRPTYNKVYNIGFENPGTHTAGDSAWVVPISNKEDVIDDFPFNIEVEPWAEAEFKMFYQSVNGGKTLVERQTYYRKCMEKWLELKQKEKSITDVLLDNNINRVAIYGTGTIGKLLAGELAGKIEIQYFVMTKKNIDNFMGYPVWECGTELEGKTEELTLIVIPGYDIEKIEKSVGERFLKIYSIDVLLHLADL